MAMRVPGLFDNYGSCPDFTVNTPGTCKHIEAPLLRLPRLSIMAPASDEISEIAEASGCYRGLDQFRRQLVPIRLRRTRKEVLKVLPPRTDQVFYVPLAEKKAEPYSEQHDILGKLMPKWQRQ